MAGALGPLAPCADPHARHQRRVRDGGLELALLGDVLVAEQDAVFGVFCRHWGVLLIEGGTVWLQAVVGLGHAFDMILTGREVGAQEALQMGFANTVVPTGRALEEAAQMARQF